MSKFRKDGSLKIHERPTMKRNRQLLRLYGISLNQFEDMAAKQNLTCAICGRISPLEVDHNHTYNFVRGLLCHKCNAILGGIERVGIWRFMGYLDK